MHLGLGSGKRSMAVQGAGSLNYAYAWAATYVQLASDSLLRLRIIHHPCIHDEQRSMHDSSIACCSLVQHKSCVHVLIVVVWVYMHCTLFFFDASTNHTNVTTGSTCLINLESPSSSRSVRGVVASGGSNSTSNCFNLKQQQLASRERDIVDGETWKPRRGQNVGRRRNKPPCDSIIYIPLHEATNNQCPQAVPDRWNS